MREKRVYLVISFNQHEEAIELEQICKDYENLGRIIPTPSQVCAGCGLSFKSELENEMMLKELIDKNNLKYDKISYVNMY